MLGFLAIKERADSYVRLLWFAKDFLADLGGDRSGQRRMFLNAISIIELTRLEVYFLPACIARSILSSGGLEKSR